MNSQTVVVIAYHIKPAQFPIHLEKSGFVSLIKEQVKHKKIEVTELKPIHVTIGGKIISLNPDFKPAAFHIYFEGDINIPKILGNITDECLKECQIRPLICHDHASPGELFNMFIESVNENDPETGQHLIHQMALQPGNKLIPC